MLTTLARLSRDEARDVLAAAARTILPDPGIPDSFVEGVLPRPDDPIVERVLSEARERLHLGTDTSPDSIAKIATFLSSALSRTVVSADEVDRVRARAGEKGILPPALYQISFSRKFEDAQEIYRVRKNHVQAAITRPDLVQHLLPTSWSERAVALVSLFVKTPPVTKGIAYSLLIKCERYGSRLLVDDAVRVYHDEVNLAGAGSPLEILRRFLDKFGMDLTIDGETARLFVGKVIQGKAGKPIRFTSAAGSSEYRPEEDGPIEIIIAYAIGNVPYVAQLGRHGVEAKVDNKSRLSVHFRPRQ